MHVTCGKEMAGMFSDQTRETVGLEDTMEGGRGLNGETQCGLEIWKGVLREGMHPLKWCWHCSLTVTLL